MNKISGTTGAMHCSYCGRPAATLVWIGGMGYHAECTRGPGWVQDTYQSLPQPWGFPPQGPAMTEQGVHGMTLRDYFAIHGPEPTKQQADDYMTGWTMPDNRLARAKLRYLEADAMLLARKVVRDE